MKARDLTQGHHEFLHLEVAVNPFQNSGPSCAADCRHAKAEHQHDFAEPDVHFLGSVMYKIPCWTDQSIWMSFSLVNLKGLTVLLSDLDVDERDGIGLTGYNEAAEGGVA